MFQVLFFEIVVSGGTAVLTVVAMPHLDIVTNVTILNSVALMSTFLQVISQCSAKQNNRFLVPSLTALALILLGYVLFGFLYIMKDPGDVQMIIWVGLAIGGSFLVSFNWWETYFKVISESSSNVRLKNLCKDMSRCENVLHMLSSIIRIAVTAAVVGAYVPLGKMDWEVVMSIPSRETRYIVITIGVQLVSTALCHWFAVAACKMHALRRCYIIPLYLASLGVMVFYIVPVIVYYQEYKIGLNGTATNFSTYCTFEVDQRDVNLTGGIYPELVLDVTHTLCFLDMSKIWDIGILTGKRPNPPFITFRDPCGGLTVMFSWTTLRFCGVLVAGPGVGHAPPLVPQRVPHPENPGAVRQEAVRRRLHRAVAAPQQSLRHPVQNQGQEVSARTRPSVRPSPILPAVFLKPGMSLVVKFQGLRNGDGVSVRHHVARDLQRDDEPGDFIVQVRSSLSRSTLHRRLSR